jgi:hypothetical protein
LDETVATLFPQEERFTDYQWLIAKGKHLHPEALKHLDSLIERIELAGQRVLVILTSAWRNDATLKQHREEVFIQHQFCKYLCGKTAPHGCECEWTPECKSGFLFAQGAQESFGLELTCRADVIEFWLQDHGFGLDTTNFVVIDDDTFAGLQRFEERFIRTRELFLEEDLERAAKVLKV